MGTWRDSVPMKSTEIRADLKRFAKENNLVLNPYTDHKIEWMEQHGGQCYCEPNGSRHCPCEQSLGDLTQFNGVCLCRVVMTPERLEALIKYKSKPKPENKSKSDGYKKKEKDSKELFNKLYNK